jgi:hypothetical protein
LATYSIELTRCADKYPMPESELKSKAKSPNLLCSHLTRVHPVSREGREPKAEQDALLEEISLTRAVVSLECPLRKGSTVRIDCRTCELRGKVLGCKHGATGYVAEVAFPANQPWQPSKFKPDGLFNPNYLVCKNPGCTPECVGGSCGESEAEPDTST